MILRKFFRKKSNDLDFNIKIISGWSINCIEFSTGNLIVKTIVHGMIANFTPSSVQGRERLKNWKRKIAIQVKSKRSQLYNPDDTYAVSIGMKFHTPLHGEQKLDLDNFSKPIIDAIAAGLFCKENEDPRKFERYNQFDDSNFKHIFLDRLVDAKQENEEGITIIVSKK